MKWKLAWCALGLFVIGGGLWLLLPADPISRATYHKIHMGMTLEEAEALVGRPSIGIDEMMDLLFNKRRVRWVAPRPQDILHEGNDWSKARPDLTRIKCWEGTRGGLSVQLGDDGRIIGKRFEEGSSMGLVERFRYLLGW